MALSFHGFLFGCFAYLVTSITNYNVIAGLPSKRVSREIYPEIESDNFTNQSGVCIVGDVVYTIDEVVPAEQPCLKCRCKPPEVQCKAIRCSDKKPGCKVVHKANMCCPDYQCDCEYNGKKYSNGERLQISPEDKCKVCYCRGGEIQCADVSCYVRNDCEGKRVAGQCCLKYDHCPTRDSLEKLQTNIHSMPGTLPNNENVEWRPSNESESNNFHTQNDQGRENQTQIGVVETDYPKITIQEIISGVREIPVSSDTNYESYSGTDSNKMADVQFGGDKSNDVYEVDSDAEPSEISEVIESSPSVIRIGENLFVLGKDELVNDKDAGVTPSSIITLIGAEGLQQGGIEEMAYNETSLPPQPSSTSSPSTSTNYVNNIDLSSASSTHILSLVKKKKKGNLTPTSTVRATPLSTDSSTFIELENRKIDNATEFEYVSQNSNTPSEYSVSSPPTSDISTASDHVEIREIGITDKANSSEGELYELQGENITTSSPVSPGKLGKSNDDEFVSLIDLRAALPEEILNVQLDEFDEDENKKNTEKENVTGTYSSENPEFETVDFVRSIETMENSQEYSGEKTTTSSTNSKPVISDENASIDNEKEKISEANDMLADKKPSPDLSHDEAQRKPDEKKTLRADFDADSVEILEATESQNFSTTDIPEIKPAKIENLSKNIHKRENPVLSEDDSIFAQLNQELGLGTSEKLKTAEEEDNEARKIFQELLEETSTKTSQRKEGRSKENESLERITQALAKLALRGSQPIDISALGVIRDFFSSQYRSYDTKTV